jgi:hypothetical protein
MALAEESRTLSVKAGDLWNTAIALHSLALLAYGRGDYQRSKTLNEEALTLMRQVGDRWLLAYPLIGLAHVAHRQGDYPLAAALYREAMINSRRLGNMRFVALCLDGIAGVQVALGYAARAARLLGGAAALREMINTPIPRTWQTDHERDQAAARGALENAVFSAAWAEGRAMTPEQAMGYALADPGPQKLSRVARTDRPSARA